jgi:hypothetical protein
MSDFPEVHKAMVIFEKAHAAMRLLPNGRPERTDPTLQNWMHVHEIHTQARQSVIVTYRTELLPTILGGKWSQSINSGILWRKLPTRNYQTHALLDHPLYFHRFSHRSYKNSVLIGRPYFPVDEEYVSKIAGECPTIGFWIRTDLSAWYPGETALVIIAEELLTKNPAQFGFRAIVP